MENSRFNEIRDTYNTMCSNQIKLNNQNAAIKSFKYQTESTDIQERIYLSEDCRAIKVTKTNERFQPTKYYFADFRKDDQFKEISKKKFLKLIIKHSN